MHRVPSRALLAMACVAAATLAGARAAHAQAVSSENLTCVNVANDKRFAKMPGLLELTPQDEEFMESQGCKVTGGGSIARADRLCYPTAVEESSSEPGGSDDVGGVDLTGQVFLCYDVRCRRDEMTLGNVRTELTVTDRFGEGQLFINERPTTKELCVPAVIGEAPSPTPGPSGTPGATPTPGASATPQPTATPGATGTPGATATPGPTSTPPGSASRAFVDQVSSLLR